MQRFALTGGIAEGKTTVLGMFQRLGVATLSSDEVVARLLCPGTELWQQLVERFGQTIVNADGTLSRPRLAELAFGNPSNRRVLNRLVHPAVVAEIRREAEQPTSAPLLIEVPLLVEVAWQGWFDGILVVQATPRLQYQRLLARGIPEPLITALLASQLPTRAKVPFADWVIRTHCSLERTARQVERIGAFLMGAGGVYSQS